jgi:hypothetical protein
MLPPIPAAVTEYFRRRQGSLYQLTSKDLAFNETLWRRTCGLLEEPPDIDAQDALRPASAAAARGEAAASGIRKPWRVLRLKSQPAAVNGSLRCPPVERYFGHGAGSRFFVQGLAGRRLTESERRNDDAHSGFDETGS